MQLLRAIDRSAARFRQRFQAVKRRVRERAEEEGLLEIEKNEP